MKLLINKKMNALMITGTQASDVYEESLNLSQYQPSGFARGGVTLCQR